MTLKGLGIKFLSPKHDCMGHSNDWRYSITKKTSVIESHLFCGVLVIFLHIISEAVQSKYLVLYIFTMNWKSCEGEVYNTHVTKQLP